MYFYKNNDICDSICYNINIKKENFRVIYDKYMILGSKPITPIYNSKDELEDMSVYDE